MSHIWDSGSFHASSRTWCISLPALFQITKSALVIANFLVNAHNRLCPKAIRDQTPRKLLEISSRQAHQILMQPPALNLHRLGHVSLDLTSDLLAIRGQLE